VAIASTGAIIAVLIMSVSSGADKLSGSLHVDTEAYRTLMGPFFKRIPEVSLETAAALAPLIIIFFAGRKWLLKQKDRTFRRIVFGLIYAFLGLVLFLVGVNAGFMDVGLLMGHHMASMDLSVLAVIVGFVLGAVTILAEPAVHVLTRQIEDVTSGSVKRRLVLIALSVGVGIAVALSMLRIFIPQIQLWHYLLPGYIIALALALIGPKLFVGIAFDSGGVASGPMTATFILAFAQGAAGAGGGDLLVNGFGIIALVALTPLITIQILGLIYSRKLKKGMKSHAS
jgi:putative flippase GtrA